MSHEAARKGRQRSARSGPARRPASLPEGVFSLQQQIGNDAVTALVGRHVPEVRIHNDHTADARARGYHAAAFTEGPDIHFRSGVLAGEDGFGSTVLAHELAHVIQQNGASGTQRLTPEEAEREATGFPSEPVTAGGVEHGTVQKTDAELMWRQLKETVTSPTELFAYTPAGWTKHDWENAGKTLLGYTKGVGEVLASPGILTYYATGSVLYHVDPQFYSHYKPLDDEFGKIAAATQSLGGRLGKALQSPASLATFVGRSFTGGLDRMDAALRKGDAAGAGEGLGGFVASLLTAAASEAPPGGKAVPPVDLSIPELTNSLPRVGPGRLAADEGIGESLGMTPQRIPTQGFHSAEPTLTKPLNAAPGETIPVKPGEPPVAGSSELSPVAPEPAEPPSTKPAEPKLEKPSAGPATGGAALPTQETLWRDAQDALVAARRSTQAPVNRSALGRIGKVSDRGVFRRELTKLLQDPEHPLHFLLDPKTNKLRPSTTKGITERDWLENPEIIEAGHYESARSLAGTPDRLAVMSAYENRFMSATIEHPTARAGSIREAGLVVDIGGIPVSANTARDWVAKNLLEPKWLANARRVSF